MNDLTILLVSDETYLNYAYAIINSINKNCSHLKIHLHLVDINEEDEQITKLRDLSIYPIDFSFSQKNLNPNKTLNKGNVSYSERGAYSANIRMNILYDLMIKGCQYLLYVDVDSIIRKDLSTLFDLIKSTEVTFQKTGSGNQYSKFKSGVIGVKTTPNSLLFFKKVSEFIEKNGYCTWGIDQLSLYHIFNEMIETKKCDWQQLPTTYLDYSFNTDSIIWTGKGQRKYLNNIYVNEYQKYFTLSSKK